MEQSSQNENRISNENGCEIMDDMMEEITKEPYERPFENHDNLQTEISVNLERENEMMKKISKHCMLKEISGKK
jgi:effector-binding domain-containing protein